MIAIIVFVIIDTALYSISPYPERTWLPWWRLAPGGGIVTYWLTRP